MANQTARVLLIEDSASDAMLMKIALDTAGLCYSLTTLEDGGKAVEYVRKQNVLPGFIPPDIILLDVNVPKVSGFEILREMRETSGFARVPVVVLSSAQSPHAKSALLGVTDASFQTKPCHLDGFLELGRAIKTRLEEAERTLPGPVGTASSE